MLAEWQGLLGESVGDFIELTFMGLEALMSFKFQRVETFSGNEMDEIQEYFIKHFVNCLISNESRLCIVN